MKVLLLTDIPPSTNYTAGLVLSQACRMMPPASLACFAIVNRELQNIEFDPQLSRLPLEFAVKPRETGAPRGSRFRFGRTYAAEELRVRIAIPDLVNRAADFAQRQNVDAIWAVLQGQTMVRVAGRLADRLNLPLHTQVWDPLSWWLTANDVDRLHRKRALVEFDEVMKRSKSCATASWAMARDYEARYGIRCVPLVACLSRDQAMHPEPRLRRDDEVVIGMAGQFYAEQEWQHFVQALNTVGWKIDGRQVRIKVLGHYLPSSPIPKDRCEFMGWRSQDETIRILSETDVLYCPYPSQPALLDVTKLSFPSKLVTYFAAGRPVLFHGPDFSSPAKFLRDHQAGLVTVGSGAPAAYNALYRLVKEPRLYAEIARNAQNVFATEFTLEQMRPRLLDFLGTTEADLAAAPPARVAFDPTAMASFLPPRPIAVSRWGKSRQLSLHVARRTAGLKQLVDAGGWVLARKRALEAKGSARRRLLEEKANELRKANELKKANETAAASMRLNASSLVTQKVIEAQLEKFIQTYDDLPQRKSRGAHEVPEGPIASDGGWLGERAVLMSQLEGTKRAYDVLAEDLHDLQRRYDTTLASVAARLSMVEWGGLTSRESKGRSIAGNQPAAVTARYLDLLEASLTGVLNKDVSISPWVEKGFDSEKRFLGRDWPEHAQTMIGTVRMRNIRYLLERIIENNVPGDVIETGVWRGGACIYMRAILLAHDQTDRSVWVADSFAGLPEADAERYPLDAGDIHHTFAELAIPLEDVQANFARYNLLDDRVRFLKGWFKDTLPSAPIEQLALLRLDGDMYSSTIETLDALYHKVSPGGFVIVDDYILPACRKAVDDFRATHGIGDELQEVDGAAVFWQKSEKA